MYKQNQKDEKGETKKGEGKTELLVNKGRTARNDSVFKHLSSALKSKRSASTSFCIGLIDSRIQRYLFK